MSDGVTVVAGVTGSLGDVTPVVLLHGLSQQRFFWGPVVRRLHHRPVVALDQRGHGESDAAASADFSISRVADDVAETLDALHIEAAHIVGHSWGAAVALRFAAQHHDRTSSVSLIDGGLWLRPPDFDREAALQRLRPPDLGIPEGELWEMIGRGELAAIWTPETKQALEPTFIVDDEGLIRTRIGVDRHLAVLGAMLDHDSWADAAVVRGPAWYAKCLPVGGSTDPLQEQALVKVAETTRILTQQWEGAHHDVPLQWPALVAGFIDAIVESAQREDVR